MKYIYPKASTSVILTVFIKDSTVTTGIGLGSLVHTSSIVGGYVRSGGTGVALAVDEDVATEGTYQAPSAAGKVRIGTPANMTSGTYELHFHDDLFATGADSVFITLGGAANMMVLTIDIQLSDLEINTSMQTVIENNNLDHLLKVSTEVAADGDLSNHVVTGTVMAHVMASGADVTTAYNASEDSLEAIRLAQIAATPTGHLATANTETTGTLDGGTYAETATNDDSDYYQTGPETPADGNGFGMDVYLTFGIGVGRVPSTAIVDGHFAAGALRTVQVWAYNYFTAAYVQLSNTATDFGSSASTDSQFTYSMTTEMVQVADGEVKIRFTSTSTTITDVWNCDYVQVNSVAQTASGLTANAIQAAVWARESSGHDEHTLGYNLAHTHILQGDVSSATSANQFIIDAGVAVNDAYNGMLIMLEDKTDDHYETRRIVDYIGATNEVFVDRAFGFTPVALDDYYIMSAGYADVNVTHVAATAQTANDNSADINTLITQVGTAGAGLSDLGGMSTGMKAEVNAEADTALSDINLDHLLKETTSIAADGDLSNHVVTGTVMAHLMSTNANVTTNYNASEDSLQAIKDHAVTIKAETAAIQIETTALDTLTKAAGDGDLAAILNDTDLIDDATSGLAKIATDVAAVLVDTNTTIPGTIATVDANVDAILVDTATTIPATIATIDTNVDAILVDTATTIPASIAALPTAAENTDAVWDELIATHTTVGSTARSLAAAGGSGDPWETALPGSYADGTAGYLFNEVMETASITSVDSSIEIFNLALGLIGEYQASASDTTTKQYILCDRFYTQALKKTLAKHPWNEAIGTDIVMQSTTAPLTEFAYKYAKPSDALKIMSIGSDLYHWEVRSGYIETDYFRIPNPWATAIDYVEGQYIQYSSVTYVCGTTHTSDTWAGDAAYWTSQSGDYAVIDVTYKKLITNVSLMSAELIDVIAQQLAIMIATPLTGDPKIKEALVKEYEELMLPAARSVDAIEGRMKSPFQSSWIRSRS